MIRIAHIADLHIRGMSRHDEYKQVFQEFANDVKKRQVHHIFIGGDIFHTKTSGISPEYIDFMSWFLETLSAIAPTHLILGNHDGNLTNLTRQDAVTPIVNALNIKNVTLYKKSGVYEFSPGFNWCVFSLFDENWDAVKPVDGMFNIACYHGPVRGAVSESDWKIDEGLTTDHFNDYDLCFLGDIHRTQYLGYRDIGGKKKPWIAYPGSTVQQNYAESLEHGYLLWEISGKDDHNVEFCQLPNPRPFITFDWQGDVAKTVKLASTFPSQSRFRVKHNSHLSHKDSVELTNVLKRELNASEVTFKGELITQNDYVNARDTIIAKNDLRNVDSLIKLTKTYHKNVELDANEWQLIGELIKRYLSTIQDDETARNVSWTLKHLKFDNLFCYGEGNEINFQNLNGIIGIFGPNRTGKSSIPGTLMYSLFNTTDRGSIKNLHVVNSRKQFGYSRVILEANGTDYVIERQTVKNENKKQEVNAATALNFFRLSNGELIDLCGEQRTDTEKSIRKCIGSFEDVELTSLAAQEELNQVIKIGSTKRSEMLSRFMDLDIFSKMWKVASQDMNNAKTLLKRLPEKDWDNQIKEKQQFISLADQKIRDLSNQTSETHDKIQKVKSKLSTLGDATTVTEFQLSQTEERIVQIRSMIKQLTDKKQLLVSKIEKSREKIEKIESLKSEYDIDALRKRETLIRKLETTVTTLKHEHGKKQATLKQQKKTLTMLKNVPCGDQFPLCHYIKDAHEAKKKFPAQEEKVNIALAALEEAENELKEYDGENVIEKIKKLEEMSNLHSTLVSDIANEQLNLYKIESQIDTAKAQESELNARFVEMKEAFENNENVEAIAARNELEQLQRMIVNLDSEKTKTSERRGRAEHEIETLMSEKLEHQHQLQQLKIHELIAIAFSKKGIPSLILTERLPMINAEIAKILSGIVDFTVELQKDDSDQLEIYLNYGDSRRLVELGSGMEKTTCAIALRVALINISTLPKPDFFIIDEGFGVYDDAGVEAVSSLLRSLKKFFRVIFVITHIDGIKDVADNIIEITKTEKDSRIVCK